MNLKQNQPPPPSTNQKKKNPKTPSSLANSTMKKNIRKKLTCFPSPFPKSNERGKKKPSPLPPPLPLQQLKKVLKEKI